MAKGATGELISPVPEAPCGNATLSTHILLSLLRVLSAVGLEVHPACGPVCSFEVAQKVEAVPFRLQDRCYPDLWSHDRHHSLDRRRNRRCPIVSTSTCINPFRVQPYHIDSREGCSVEVAGR